MKFSASTWMGVCLKTVESITAPVVKSGLARAVLTTLLGTTTATLVGFGSTVKSATAETVYPFETTYDIKEVLTPIPGTDLFETLVSGYNPNAPYGLTDYTVRTYVQPDFDSFTVVFNTDPAKFGLEGFPEGSVVFSGSGNDQLFGSSSGSATPDFITGRISGLTTNIITGGTGIFSGATGIINLFQSGPISDNPDPNIPITTTAFLSGFIQTPQKVPEPTATTILVSIGLTGSAFLLRQRHLQSKG